MRDWAHECTNSSNTVIENLLAAGGFHACYLLAAVRPRSSIPGPRHPPGRLRRAGRGGPRRGRHRVDRADPIHLDHCGGTGGIARRSERHRGVHRAERASRRARRLVAATAAVHVRARRSTAACSQRARTHRAVETHVCRPRRRATVVRMSDRRPCAPQHGDPHESVGASSRATRWCQSARRSVRPCRRRHRLRGLQGSMDLIGDVPDLLYPTHLGPVADRRPPSHRPRELAAAAGAARAAWRGGGGCRRWPTRSMPHAVGTASCPRGDRTLGAAGVREDNPDGVAAWARAREEAGGEGCCDEGRRDEKSRPTWSSCRAGGRSRGCSCACRAIAGASRWAVQAGTSVDAADARRDARQNGVGGVALEQLYSFDRDAAPACASPHRPGLGPTAIRWRGPRGGRGALFAMVDVPALDAIGRGGSPTASPAAGRRPRTRRSPCIAARGFTLGELKTAYVGVLRTRPRHPQFPARRWRAASSRTRAVRAESGRPAGLYRSTVPTSRCRPASGASPAPSDGVTRSAPVGGPVRDGSSATCVSAEAVVAFGRISHARQGLAWRTSTVETASGHVAVPSRGTILIGPCVVLPRHGYSRCRRVAAELHAIFLPGLARRRGRRIGGAVYNVASTGSQLGK